ncbi:Arylsulfatase [Dactylella cylindrospora]|nr:Arylsulfatase [Dactylella cylindrospora]
MPAFKLKEILLFAGVVSAVPWDPFASQRGQRLLNPSPQGGSDSPGKPNIIFILTDDQDIEMNSLDYMPFVKKHLLDKGTLFRNHFVTTALCCPSRVSLWTGRHSHNTNVTDVNPPYGGYPKFISQGFNDNFLPVWLQQGGYNTYYAGKLFNAHATYNYDKPHVKGFTESDFLLDPWTYNYLNPAYQRNHDAPIIYRGQHTLDVLSNKAYAILDNALASGKPFFLGLAPVAPHSNIEGDISDINDLDKIKFSEPIPLKRHENLFPDAKVPRTPHFNPDKPSGVSWIAKRPKLNKTVVDHNDFYYRQRLRALQGVDELVDGVFKRLEKYGPEVLENTYIFYTADNGFHVSQHRLNPGKECGFEDDIRVPFIVRGPGIAEGKISKSVTTHIDVAPTLFELAGIDQREDFDGIPIPLKPASQTKRRHEHVNVEYWGFAAEEGSLGGALYLNNTYKSLRIIGDTYNLYYSVWCNNEHQLYDLTTDPYQLRNIYPGYADYDESLTILGQPLTKVIDRLDTLLLVLKSCKGTVCVKPWEKLHPDGNVESLRDSLSPSFDAFYKHQESVRFDRCEFGYILDAEGPQEAFSYTRHGAHWSEWV